MANPTQQTPAIAVLILQIKRDAEEIFKAAEAAEARIDNDDQDAAIADLIDAEAAIDTVAGLFRTTMALHRRRSVASQ